MNWKKGDMAICVKPKTKYPGLGLNLKMNAEYIVGETYACACGMVSLEIGIVSPPNRSGYTICDCGRKFLDNGYWYIHSSRFIKKDPRSIEERIAEAVEKEEYELAHELTQLQRSI